MFYVLIDVKPEIKEEERFNNGTGYFDGLESVKFESPVKFIDDANRPVVVVPLKSGRNLIVFQRYSNDDRILVSNGIRAFASALTEDQISLVEDFVSGKAISEDRFTKIGIANWGAPEEGDSFVQSMIDQQVKELRAAFI